MRGSDRDTERDTFIDLAIIWKSCYASNNLLAVSRFNGHFMLSRVSLWVVWFNVWLVNPVLCPCYALLYRVPWIITNLSATYFYVRSNENTGNRLQHRSRDFLLLRTLEGNKSSVRVVPLVVEKYKLGCWFSRPFVLRLIMSKPLRRFSLFELGRRLRGSSWRGWWIHRFLHVYKCSQKFLQVARHSPANLTFSNLRGNFSLPSARHFNQILHIISIRRNA